MSNIADTKNFNVVAIGILALWFALALAGNFMGVFRPDPQGIPLNLVSAIFLPVVVFVLAYTFSKTFRGYIGSLDLGLLTMLQSWRVVGAGFLFLYAYGILPGLWAIPAGWGDVAVGITAPYYAWRLLSRDKSFPTKAFVAWNILGLLDFAVALGLGVLTSAGPLGLLSGFGTTEALNVLPLVMIPTFVVPLFLLIHLATLIRVRQMQKLGHPASAGYQAAPAVLV